MSPEPSVFLLHTKKKKQRPSLVENQHRGSKIIKREETAITNENHRKNLQIQGKSHVTVYT
jgi:hypothetical protein